MESMKKLKITFSVDIDDRDNIRDTIIKLDKVIKKLKERWKKMEITIRHNDS